MHAADQLDAEIVRIDKEIVLARKRLELAELLSQNRLSDSDHETMVSFQDTLKQILDGEIGRMHMVQPVDPSVQEFARDWIAVNWANRFQYIEVANSELPHAIVQDALRELYELNGRNVERRGEITELHNNFQKAMDHQLTPWWHRWLLMTVRWRKNIRQDGIGKKASEIRTERRQHEIQRYFSAVAVAFTFTTALFMTAMLAVGVLQLYNAVAEGAGISLQVLTRLEQQSLVVKAQAESHVAVTRWLTIDEKAIADPHKAMQTSLLALEIILVAPLPYLLVLGLTRYIKALAYQERATEFRRELLEFKAFEVALFIAIIAAAVVERVLSTGLTYEFSISVVLVLAVLAAYYFLIESASKVADQEDAN
jgi:hypothetical protein